MNKYESHNASKVSVVRTRYDYYHMLEGQSVFIIHYDYEGDERIVDTDGRDGWGFNSCSDPFEECARVMEIHRSNYTYDHQ